MLLITTPYYIIQITTIIASTAHLGMAQGYSCDFQSSAPLCPGAYVSCTCVVTGNTSTTQWRFSKVELCQGNSISLSQQCLDTPSAQRCGQYLSAANADPPNGVLCTTSILNITAHATLDGMMVECWDMSSSTRVGTTDITIVTDPPGPPVRLNIITGSQQLTVTWTPPTTGGVPTSYNVTINDSSNTLVPIPTSGPLQHTFTNLTKDTLYTVFVVAINCFGYNEANETCTCCHGNTELSSTSPTVTPTSTFSSPDSKNDKIGFAAVGGSLAIGVVLICIVAYCCCKHCCKKFKAKDMMGTIMKNGTEMSTPQTLRGSLSAPVRQNVVQDGDESVHEDGDGHDHDEQHVHKEKNTNIRSRKGNNII